MQAPVALAAGEVADVVRVDIADGTSVGAVADLPVDADCEFRAVGAVFGGYAPGGNGLSYIEIFQSAGYVIESRSILWSTGGTTEQGSEWLRMNRTDGPFTARLRDRVGYSTFRFEGIQVRPWNGSADCGLYNDLTADGSDPFGVGVSIPGPFVSVVFRDDLSAVPPVVADPIPLGMAHCVVYASDVDEPVICMATSAERDSYVDTLTQIPYLVWAGTHHDRLSGDGPSIAVIAGTCDDFEINLNGTSWGNVISSSEAGCASVEHWADYLGGTPPIGLAGDVEVLADTERPALDVLNNRTSGLRYTLSAPPGLCNGVTLEVCFAPELRFHPNEDYFPMDPHDFVQGSELRWASDSLCPDQQISAAPTPEGLAGLSYQAYERTSSSLKFWDACNPITDRLYNTDEFTRPFSAAPGNEDLDRALRSDGVTPLEEHEGFFLEWTSGDGNRGPTPVDGVGSAPTFATIYTDDTVGRMITYQFFYGHDPKDNVIDALWAHQGDWERIDVLLDSFDQPTAVRYHGHDCEPTVVAWADAELADGTHPAVYVAKGSHAAYGEEVDGLQAPLCGASGISDNAQYLPGSALWQTWLGDVIDPSTQCWYQFGGAWGATTDGTLFYRGATTGPEGPPWKATGMSPDGPGSQCGSPGVSASGSFNDVGWGDVISWTLSGPGPVCQGGVRQLRYRII